MNEEKEFAIQLGILIQNLEEYIRQLTDDIIRYQEAKKSPVLTEEAEIIAEIINTYSDCLAIIQQQVDHFKSLLPILSKPHVCPESKRLAAFILPN